jgi:AcrR family transcriptional regulator
MYEYTGTADTLVQAARKLFAANGFDGTSVRAITTEAGTNLGAITYHFGSKQALYEAVIASAIGPSRERLRAAAAESGEPLDRIEAFVRAFFAFLHESPDLPQLMMQQLASSRPIQEAALQTIRGNIETLAVLIHEGQVGGSIRPGDARLMALSIGAQPIWLTLARRALQEGVAIDQTDSATRAQIVESVTRFVRAGLAAFPEKAE